MKLEAVTFEPYSAPDFAAVAPHLTADGPDLRCSFETYWCRDRITLVGGLDEHHRWPMSLGGPIEPTDLQGRLLLCPMHHRRQHALVRAMIEAGTTGVHTLRRFAPLELETAMFAVAQWASIGRPRIAGWPTPAAVLR